MPEDIPTEISRHYKHHLEAMHQYVLSELSSCGSMRACFCNHVNFIYFSKFSFLYTNEIYTQT